MKRVGIRDVAEHAGVSTATVSNALNRPHLVSEKLVERVRSAADQLRCVPFQAAQQLRAGSGLLGMTVINHGDEPVWIDFDGTDAETGATVGLRELASQGVIFAMAPATAEQPARWAAAR